MRLDFEEKKNVLKIVISGEYIRYENDAFMQKIIHFMQKKTLRQIIVQNEGIKNWDSSLLVILYQIKKLAEKKQILFNYDTLPNQIQNLMTLAFTVKQKNQQKHNKKTPFLECLADRAILYTLSIKKANSFVYSVLSSIKRFFKKNAIMQKTDFYFSLEECGTKAVGIVSLISFMVGLILAFVGSIQLQSFGAQVYIASLVMVAMIRIMGAIMTGIIMAGRTGAAYAAQIGTMQVNEEVDALKTMGIPITDFLILPRLFALTISMPLLTLLSDFMGILGGAFVGIFLLNIPFYEYIKFSQDAFGLTNFLVGIFHSIIYGIVIALCACYFGINCGKDADSVGKATTHAVVYSIVWMIVMTGIITLTFQVMGI